MSEAEHEGGCLCGAIRYRVEGEPTGANICYCSQCRRQTGAAMPSFVAYKLDRFRLLSGTPRAYRASDFATREFCPHCGSSLFWRRDGADELDIFLGTLDDPDAMPKPRDQIWTRHRPAWVPALPEIPAYPEARPKKA